MSATLPPIHLFDTVTSTNDFAVEAARDGAPHGSCWAADAQTLGRGRREEDGTRRTWFSPARSNLYLSTLVRFDLDPLIAPTLTLAAGVGVVRALDEILGERLPDGLWIKWPNDIWIGERKLGGILSEGVLEDSRLVAVVIGIGLNVNLSLSALPDTLRGKTASLITTGEEERPVDRLALLLSLRHHVISCCEEVAAHGLASTFLDDLRALDRLSGRRVEIKQGGAWTTGRADGIDVNGALFVILDEGERVRVHAGDVRLIEAPRNVDV